MYYHVNGDLVPAEEATVSIRDRGFRYGDAVHATLRVYGGAVFEWEAHEKRLRRACDRLGFADGVPADLHERLGETLERNGLEDARLDVSITRGNNAGLAPDEDVPTVVVTAENLPRGGLDGERAWTAPAVTQTVKTRTIPDVSIPREVQTHERLDAVLARLELERARTDQYEADEALVRDVEGHLVGGAASSVFFVEDGTLKTPSLDGAVPRVLREVVLHLAREETFPVETGQYMPVDVREADEAFLTNATWELRPIARVDGIAVGAGPITRLLTRLFDELVEQRYYAD